MTAAAGTGPAVLCRGLHRRFGARVAVVALDLEIPRGGVYGLLGHNGAGKTTTIRLLNGVLDAHGGAARVLDLDPWTDGPALRARTGVLTEDPGLDGRLTARESLALHAAIHGIRGPGGRAAVDAALETFGLLARAGERVAGFSRGMRQRLALARALVHGPELLFLDEPTTTLDPAAARGLRALVQRIADEGRTVVLCTHDLVHAQALCDRVAVLQHGRLLAEGTPADLAGDAASGAVEFDVGAEAVDRAAAVLGGPGRAAPDAVPGVVLARGLARAGVPEAVSALVAAGVPVHGVRAREPSLEDVYLAIVESAGGP